MEKESETSVKIKERTKQALLDLRYLVDNDEEQNISYFRVVSLLLQGVITTAVDLVEIRSPGLSSALYAEIETFAKSGGLHEIEKIGSKRNSYSISNIAPDDMASTMNYLGQKMSTALFKGINELPVPLRQEETQLRAIEAILTNLLSDKFNNPHDILNSFCEHVHMSLNDLSTRDTPIY